MEVLNKATYERLNKFGDQIRNELTQWANEKKYPFSVRGIGSHIGYEFSDIPGRAYKTCRDIFEYSNETNMQTFAFEMANRGIFPMYRGQVALSEPMTEKDIDTFINVSKEIVDSILEGS
jgi:glutamate-1-semialdehyde 2,1-aminomutase